jgi:dolichol-phosphate mannosyltransferase
MIKYSLILPCKEEPYIYKLVQEIQKKIKNHEIIIVDKSKIKPVFSYKNVIVIDQKSSGIGMAFLEGLKIAKGEFIAVLDCDGSHDVNDLKRLLTKMPEYDIAIGSKLVKGGKTEDELSRRIVTRCFNLLARLILGIKVNDSMTGFMVVKKSVLEKIKLKPKGFKIVLEVLYKSKSINAKVAEVPITFHKRKSGESKVGFNIKGLKEAFRILKLMIELRKGAVS